MGKIFFEKFWNLVKVFLLLLTSFLAVVTLFGYYKPSLESIYAWVLIMFVTVTVKLDNITDLLRKDNK